VARYNKRIDSCGHMCKRFLFVLFKASLSLTFVFLFTDSVILDHASMFKISAWINVGVCALFVVICAAMDVTEHLIVQKINLANSMLRKLVDARPKRTTYCAVLGRRQWVARAGLICRVMKIAL
jgi:uncharacterized membrane protein